MHSFKKPRFGGYFLLILMSVIVVLAQGCARSQLAPEKSEAPLDTCCTDLEDYPQWLVDLARLAAPELGRATNRISWRRGFIKSRKDAQTAILGNLQPLDIVIVSSKGRKSGQLIPGLFGHAAIYMGTQAQLRELGVWNAAETRPHQDQIRKSLPFIEADAKGVHLSPASIVLNTDRVVVLRQHNASLKRRRQIARGFFDAIGMDFDFLFDVETSDCTFCTELIHRVIPELRLPVQTVYGVKTIVPDRVIAAALKQETDLEMIFYVKADRISWRQAPATELVDDIDAYWNNRRKR